MMTEMTQSTQEKKYSKWHWAWILVLLAAGIVLCLVRCSGPQPTEFNMPEIDLHAERVESSAGSRVYTEFTAHPDVTVNLTDGSASLYFVNPAVSEMDLVLSLNVDGKVIGQSGRLTPGTLLETMTELDTEDLSAGTYDGSIVADQYDSATGERQMINLEIDVSVHVVP